MQNNTQPTASTHFKVVLFDVGSTLIYFDGARSFNYEKMYRALYDSLNESGLNLDPAFLKTVDSYLVTYFKEVAIDYVEQPVEKKLVRMLGEFGYLNIPDEVIQKAARDMYRVSQEYWQPEEDALPMLEELKSSGYRLGVISNADYANDVETLIDKGHFRPYMDIILISAREGWRKPHPAMFRKALDFFKVPASQAVMVGDTLDADIAGANQMGIASVWICRRADRPENNKQVGKIHPGAVIEKLSELPGLLNNWKTTSPVYS
jgi:HAD superfamily hydrolase (TIGR01662 family)